MAFLSFAGKHVRASSWLSSWFTREFALHEEVQRSRVLSHFLRKYEHLSRWTAFPLGLFGFGSFGTMQVRRKKNTYKDGVTMKEIHRFRQLILAALLDGPRAFGYLAEFSGASQNRVWRALRWAQKKGYVRKLKQGFYALTETGRTYLFSKAEPDTVIESRWPEIIDRFPEPYQSALKLLLASIVGIEQTVSFWEDDGLPSHVWFGQRETGKNKLAKFAMHLAGLKNPEEHFIIAATLAPGSVIVRRQQTSEGIVLQPSEIIKGPVFVFDEIHECKSDKASVKTGIWTLFQGRRRLNTGDGVLEVQLVPLACFNMPETLDPGTPEGLKELEKFVPTRVISRAVLWNTWSVVKSPEMLQLFDEVEREIKPLDWAWYVIKAHHLPSALKEFLIEARQRCMTLLGAENTRIESLECLTLMISPFTRDDLLEAIHETLRCYLTLAETCHWTHPEWRARLAALYQLFRGRHLETEPTSMTVATPLIPTAIEQAQTREEQLVQNQAVERERRLAFSERIGTLMGEIKEFYYWIEKIRDPLWISFRERWIRPLRNMKEFVEGTEKSESFIDLEALGQSWAKLKARIMADVERRRQNRQELFALAKSSASPIIDVRAEPVRSGVSQSQPVAPQPARVISSQSPIITDSRLHSFSDEELRALYKQAGQEKNKKAEQKIYDEMLRRAGY